MVLVGACGLSLPSAHDAPGAADEADAGWEDRGPDAPTFYPGPDAPPGGAIADAWVAAVADAAGACDNRKGTCDTDIDAAPCGGTETDCADGINNDCDDQIDCNDPDCYGQPACAGDPSYLP